MQLSIQNDEFLPMQNKGHRIIIWKSQKTAILAHTCNYTQLSRHTLDYVIIVNVVR